MSVEPPSNETPPHGDRSLFAEGERLHPDGLAYPYMAIFERGHFIKRVKPEFIGVMPGVPIPHLPPPRANKSGWPLTTIHYDAIMSSDVTLNP